MINNFLSSMININMTASTRFWSEHREKQNEQTKHAVLPEADGQEHDPVGDGKELVQTRQLPH